MACPRKGSVAGANGASEKGSPNPRTYVAKSVHLSIIDWLHVSRLYVPYALAAALIFAIYALLPPISSLPNLDMARMIANEVANEMTKQGMVGAYNATSRAFSNIVATAGDSSPELSLLITKTTTIWKHLCSVWYAYAIIIACLIYLLTTKPAIYMLDFSVYEPPPSWRVSREEIVEILRRYGFFSEESINFMQRLLERSGTGDATHWPPGCTMLLEQDGNVDPKTGKKSYLYDDSMYAAKAVAETILINTVQDALRRSRVKPQEVDFVIVNCSLFCPTPSLASLLVKHFKFKKTVKTYSLGGMGCSAGVISIDLAKQLLQNKRGSVAVVVSFEEITQQMYRGSVRSMLLQNTLFRVGGAAVVLSSKRTHGFRAKYKLLHTVRTQESSDVAYSSVVQTEDEERNKGIALSKEITVVAGRLLRDNLTILGPHVLPLSEQAKVAWSILTREVRKKINSMADAYKWARVPFSDAKTGRLEVPNAYVPDFKRAINHYCIHAGGRAVIDTIETGLKLHRYHTAPSRATLYHWGNTSSSSIWYELRYCESGQSWEFEEERMRKMEVADEEASKPVFEETKAKFVTSTLPDGTTTEFNENVPGASVRRVRARAGSAFIESEAEAAQMTPINFSNAHGDPKPTPTTLMSVPTLPAVNGKPFTPTSPNLPGETPWDPNRKWYLPDYEGRGIQKGERVLQIAFGSGFKCNSAVWLKMK